MANEDFREEVLNVSLARLLSARGFVSSPETIHKKAAERRLPDVLVSLRGLRLIIEGKVENRSAASADALRRVEEGMAHISIAVVYPKELRAVAFADLDGAMENSDLDVQIFTESGATSWVTTDIDGLANLLNRSYAQLVQEDVVAEAVEVLEEGIDLFAAALKLVPSAAERLAEVLDIHLEESPDGE